MKTDQAFAIIKEDIICAYGCEGKQWKAINQISRALRKRQPRIIIKTSEGDLCASCGNWVYKGDRYCRHCGQRVVWSINNNKGDKQWKLSL